MRRFYFKTAIIFLFVTYMVEESVFSQEVKDNPFPTQNTQIGAKPDPKKQGGKEEKIRFIIKNDTKNTLSGNLCFEEETRKMGFQYIAIPKGQAQNRNEFSRFWHNLGVRSALFFKNGPFWKSKVNKKLENCKYGSGDYVG
jgi:hypothetical protein